MRKIQGNVEFQSERTWRRVRLLSGVSAIATLLSAATVARADIQVVDVIPVGASGETGQNSEPSIAVNPNNPLQMISGAFSSTFSGNDLLSPYWMSTNGGTTWTGFGALPSSDKTLAWSQAAGGPAITVTLNVDTPPPSVTDHLTTYNSGASNFGSPVNTSSIGALDQPWVRTGPSGQTYVAINNLGNAGGKTASIEVSSNNGATYSPFVTLETVSPAGGQDAPSVRQAVNGSTVYAAFTRWGATTTVVPNQTFIFPGSDVVVTKSTNSGASFSAGTTAATTTGYFANTSNSSYTLGQERTGSDLAIAVDPNNANHVYIAYGDQGGTLGSGVLQLKVVESKDGGSTWSAPIYTTSASVRSALPAIAVTKNGNVGLLYASYNPQTNQLSQTVVDTNNDFGTVKTTVLGTQSNATPTFDFFPYLGDFYDLTAVGNEFYGIFSASNADNGTLASYADAVFQRDHAGTPGTAGFSLLNGTEPVDFSIDPFFFEFNSGPQVPEPSTWAMMLIGFAGLGYVAFRRGAKAKAAAA